jgi:alpha-ketoglutarate-dependent taurine dioxygenase
MLTEPRVLETGKADALRATVLREGWFKSRAGDHDLQLLAERIARQLGEPIASRRNSPVEPLAPSDTSSARSRSLSAIHGRGSFPIHTDGAHQLQPPRFIVLICVSPGSSPVPTTLIRFQDLAVSKDERVHLEAIPFLVRNGRQSFYSTICGATRPFIRFDEGCMVPQDNAGRELLKAVAQHSREAKSLSVDWRPGDLIVFDNWTVLHGRGFGDTKVSLDRKLLRVGVR